MFFNKKKKTSRLIRIHSQEKKHQDSSANISQFKFWKNSLFFFTERNI
jgi:hypothetical protein